MPRTQFRHVTDDDIKMMLGSRNELNRDAFYAQIRRTLSSVLPNAFIINQVPGQGERYLTLVTSNEVVRLCVSDDGQLIDDVQRSPVAEFLDNRNESKLVRNRAKAMLKVLEDR